MGASQSNIIGGAGGAGGAGLVLNTDPRHEYIRVLNCYMGDRPTIIIASSKNNNCSNNNNNNNGNGAIAAAPAAAAAATPHTSNNTNTNTNRKNKRNLSISIAVDDDNDNQDGGTLSSPTSAEVSPSSSPSSWLNPRSPSFLLRRNRGSVSPSSTRLLQPSPKSPHNSNNNNFNRPSFASAAAAAAEISNFPDVTRLSDDVLIYIFGFLSLRHWGAFARVCRHWNELANNNDAWFSHFQRDWAHLRLVSSSSSSNDKRSGLTYSTSSIVQQKIAWKQLYLDLIHRIVEFNLNPEVGLRWFCEQGYLERSSCIPEIAQFLYRTRGINRFTLASYLCDRKELAEEYLKIAFKFNNNNKDNSSNNNNNNNNNITITPATTTTTKESNNSSTHSSNGNQSSPSPSVDNHQGGRIHSENGEVRIEHLAAAHYEFVVHLGIFGLRSENLPLLMQMFCERYYLDVIAAVADRHHHHHHHHNNNKEEERNSSSSSSDIITDVEGELQRLVESGAIADTVEAKAVILRVHPRLSKAAVLDFLCQQQPAPPPAPSPAAAAGSSSTSSSSSSSGSSEPSSSSSSSLSQPFPTLDAFLGTFNFYDICIPSAIRIFFASVALGGAVDVNSMLPRLLEAFARKYCRDNSNVLDEHKCDFVVTICEMMIILNYELHLRPAAAAAATATATATTGTTTTTTAVTPWLPAPQQQQQQQRRQRQRQRLSREQFLKSIRTADADKKLKDQFFGQLYDSIAQYPLRFAGDY